MTTLVEHLAEAHRRGVVLARGSDGSLRIRRPRDAAELARALLDRKTDVLPLVDFYSGTVEALDWRTARLARPGSRCVLCGKPTLLLDPYDGQPCHKTCAESTIRQAQPEEKIA